MTVSDQLTAAEARELAVQLLICARGTEEPGDRDEAPGWIVWERATDGGRPHIRAIDLSEQKANEHVAHLKAAAGMQRPPLPTPDLLIEETRLDHLYAAALMEALRKRGERASASLLDWGTDGLYADARAVHLHGRCHASMDGDCSWRECPQRKRYQTHCPLDKGTHDDG